jgi:hypothetical protein
MPTPILLGPERTFPHIFKGEITFSSVMRLVPLANGSLISYVSTGFGEQLFTHDLAGAFETGQYLFAPGGLRSITSMTGLPDGGFAAAIRQNFYDVPNGHSDPQFFGQIYKPDGTSRSATFRLDDFVTPEGYDGNMQLLSLANGNMAAVYLHTGSDGEWNPGVRVRFFNPSGVPLGASMAVNTVTASDQHVNGVAALADGSVVVSYVDYSREGGPNTAVRGTVVRQDGTKFGFLAQTSQAEAGQVQVAGLKDGRFVMVWEVSSEEITQGGDGSGRSVVARIFNPDGSGATGEIKVSANTEGNQIQASVTALKSGGFAVAFTDFSEPDDPAWKSLPDTPYDIANIKVQLFDQNGNKDGAEITVNTTTRGTQQAPRIVELADGRLAVTWTDFYYDTIQNVRLQMLDPRTAAVAFKGTAIQDEFVGTSFNDTIGGGAANDLLAGGLGRDIFVFDKALTKGKATNLDTITDYSVNDDTIWIENAVFKAVGKGTVTKPGKLGKDLFVIGSKAKDAEDRIIYNNKTGELWYDSDGTGKAKAVEFANLSKNLKITSVEFLII